jgi:hypothetical protein
MNIELGAVELLAKATCHEAGRREERNKRRKGRKKGRKNKYLEIKK